MFTCQDCGRKYKSYRSAMRATNLGCPQCGSCDIDLNEDGAKLDHADEMADPDSFGVLRRGEIGHAIQNGTTSTY